MTEKQQQQKKVRKYVQVNLTVGPDDYKPGDTVELPEWQADELQKLGYVGQEKPPEDADGADPNVQLETHQRTEWEQEPFVRGRRSIAVGRVAYERLEEGGVNAASPWL